MSNPDTDDAGARAQQEQSAAFPPEAVAAAGQAVTHLLGNAVINPVLFDRVYESVLQQIREGRAVDPMSVVLRRMAEEVWMWREDATARLSTIAHHLGGLQPQAGDPENAELEARLFDAQRSVRGEAETLRGALEYTFLYQCPATDVPIRVGDPVIQYDDIGYAAVDGAVGDKVDVPVEARGEPEPGEDPHPGYTIVQAYPDNYSSEQMRSVLKKAEGLVALVDSAQQAAERVDEGDEEA